MNNIETKRILDYIETCYESIPRPPKFTAKSVEVWCRALADISFNDASHALSAWVLEERWPPTIADIRVKVYNLNAPADVASSQAWDQLIRALKRAYSPEAEQVWNDLPYATKLIVGGYSTFRQWGNTDTSSLESVQRPMFVKRFEEYQRRERKEAAIPRNMREPQPGLEVHEHKTIEHKEVEQDKKMEAPQDKMEELRKRLGS